MPLEQDVVDRLLVAKDLLSRIRFLPVAKPDRVTLARQVLTSHDAAELSLAGIARHLGRLPTSGNSYLMDYFPAIQKEHPSEVVAGRDYFSQLNRVRTDIKHHGIFPDPQQWYTVGERTYDYVSSWCGKYLGMRLDDLDESALISSPEVKRQLDSARAHLERADYRAVLEALAFAMEKLFRSNRALRNLMVGHPRAEDAIKLATFGVHANDFLALQEFLPHLVYESPSSLSVKWEQEKYGHPANWTQSTADFCLKTFVAVALRIQDAEWVPGAVDFGLTYEHKVTALIDGVELVQQRQSSLLTAPERVVVRTLQLGESIRGRVSKGQEPLLAAFSGRVPRHVLSFLNLKDNLWGEFEADHVRITCVPIDLPSIRKYFPDLPELDYEA